MFVTMAESVESDTSENLDYVKSESNLDRSLNLNDESDPSLSLEGSVVASPSIESFSTLPEGESSLSLAEAANDLVVRVDSPQKQADLLETYITFRVSTKTSRDDYGASAFSVRRRYNDFLWLRQHLIESYPTYFIPPLPVKHTIVGQLDRYGREFVTARMNALQMFLNRLVKHPILSFAPCFKCFLTANSEEFQELRKLTTTSILSKVSDSWKSFSTLHIETQRPPELNKLYDYLRDLSDKLNHLCRIIQRIRRERSEQIKELEGVKFALRGWAGAEADITQELCAAATAAEKCEHGMQNILLDTENFIITQPLKEYILYVEAVKETLDRRDQLEIEHEYRVELMEKKKLEKDMVEEDNDGASGLRAWVKTFETKEERLERLTQSLQSLLTSVEESKDRLECANANVRSDAERWTLDKQADFKNILLAFAEQHVSYYEQCTKAWDDASVELVKSAKQNPAPATASTSAAVSDSMGDSSHS